MAKKIKEICGTKGKIKENLPIIFIKINDKESIYNELKRILKTFSSHKRTEINDRSQENIISINYKLKAK